MQATRYRPRPAFRHFVLVLLAAFCAQASLAAHAWQHDDFAAPEDCATCVQLEQLDVPVAVGGGLAAAAPSRTLDGVPPTGDSPAVQLRAYAARAPPTL